MVANLEKVIACCSRCSKEQGTKLTKAGEPKIPFGWKRICEELYCKNCKKELYALRCMTLKVAEVIDGDKGDFYNELRQCWKTAAHVSNWYCTKLFTEDSKAFDPNAEKFHKLPQLYLYPEARERFPGVGSQAIVSIDNDTRKKYSALRFDVLKTCQKSLPTFRSPQPWPVNNACWKVTETEGGDILFAVKLMEKRWTVKIRRGKDFRYYSKNLKRIIAGEIETGAIAIDQSKSGVALIRLPFWLEKKEGKGLSGKLIVKTDMNYLLSILDSDAGKIRDIPGDRIKRLYRQRDRYQQRLRKEMKPEAKSPARRKKRRYKHLGEFSNNMSNRLKTAIDEAVAKVIGVAKRRFFAEIVYDDGDTRFLDSFQWYMLREKIKSKAEAEGIVFTHRPTELPKEVKK